MRWRQNSFKYQAKCVGWLQGDYAALPAAERGAVDSVLAAGGLAAMFAEATAEAKL